METKRASLSSEQQDAMVMVSALYMVRELVPKMDSLAQLERFLANLSFGYAKAAPLPVDAVTEAVKIGRDLAAAAAPSLPHKHAIVSRGSEAVTHA